MGITRNGGEAIGTRKKWPANGSLPRGYMRENGDAISRTAYAKLFALIGTTYGAGDGVTTFNLPDARGEFERNLDDGRGVDVGRTVGSSQDGQNEAHTHGVTDPGHKHATNDAVVVAVAGNTGLGSAGANAQVEETSLNVSNITIDSSGGSETRPRNVAFLAIIKVF